MRFDPSKNLAVIATILTLGIAGCASGGGGSTRPEGATVNRIVRAELEDLDQVDALQIISRLRPRWLSFRSGSEPVLYVDGARRIDFGDLGNMSANSIEQMEFMSGNDANLRFGTGHSGGAILVTTR